jgi:hypothetical protein
MLAKVVAASANRRAMVAAVSGKRRESATVGASGHTILMIARFVVRLMAGMSSGRINSTVIVSPEALMVPWARMVDWDKAEPHFRLGPEVVGQITPRGRPMWMGSKLA